MPILMLTPSILLGVIGWAATARLIFDTTELSPLHQRLLIVFTWLLWMVPAFDVTVYQGLITSELAVPYGSAMTVVPTTLLALSIVH